MRLAKALPVEVPLIVSAQRYPDGSCVAYADVPGNFWAVSPRGLRLRCADTRLVLLYGSVARAAAGLRELGYGPGR
jgi:hypothetical protein